MRNILKTQKTGYLSRVNPLLREFTVSDFMDLTIQTDTTSVFDLFLRGTNVIVVDWGDGGDEELIKGSFDGSSQPPFTASDAFKHTHTYASAGIYDVRIRGFIAYANQGLFSRYKAYYGAPDPVTGIRPLIVINENDVRVKKILDFSGSAQDLSNLFYNCKSLDDTDVDYSGLYQIDQLQRTFHQCDDLPYFDSQGLDSVTDIDYMFYNCPSLSGVNLRSFGNVTDGGSSFRQCRLLSDVDFTPLSGLVNAPFMFGVHSGRGVIDSGDFSSFGNLVNGAYMFQNQSLQEVDFTEVGSLTNGHQMFYRNYLDGDLSLKGLDSLQEAYYMFGDNDIENVDLSGALSLTNARYMFRQNNVSGELNLMHTPTITNADGMFQYNLLSGVDLTQISGYSNLGNLQDTFSYNRLTNVDQELEDLFAHSGLSNLSSINGMFRSNQISGVDLTPFYNFSNLPALHICSNLFQSNDIGPVLDTDPLSGINESSQNSVAIGAMFANNDIETVSLEFAKYLPNVYSYNTFLHGNNLSTIDLGPLGDATWVTNLQNFLSQNNFTTIDLNDLASLSNLSNVSFMLGDNQLSFVDLSFLTNKPVSQARYMLRGNNLTNSTDFSPFATLSSLTDLSGLLQDNNITTLNMSNFLNGKTNVSNISYAFQSNPITQVQNAHLLNSQSVISNASYAFDGCNIASFVGNNLNKVVNANYMFRNNNLSGNIQFPTLTQPYIMTDAIGLYSGNNFNSVDLTNLPLVRISEIVANNANLTSLTIPTDAVRIRRAYRPFIGTSMGAAAIDQYLIDLDSAAVTNGGTATNLSYIDFTFEYCDPNNSATLDTNRSAAALSAITSLKAKNWGRGAEANY